MRVTHLALALAFALALFAPATLAIPEGFPANAQPVAVGNRTAYFALGADALQVAVDASVAGTNASAIEWRVNVSSTNLTFATTSLVLRTPAEANGTEVWVFGATNYTAPETPGVHPYTVHFTAFAQTNGTLVLLGSAEATAGLTIERVTPPGIPTTTWLVAGSAIVVVGGGAALFAMRQRAIKRRMQGEKRRSQVMRERELEQRLEKATEKDPELAQEIREEIRAQEQVREVRREMQILQAKRADALKTLDLLKKRHEAGGLSRLQYDNMVAKKQADLARIDEEIAAMEREDAGAAA